MKMMGKNFLKVKHYIPQGFLQGWGNSLLISTCLAGVIFAAIFVFDDVFYNEKYGLEECLTNKLVYSLNLISPAQLGVVQWQIGDYATYQYSPSLATPQAVLGYYFGADDTKASRASREVKFHIIDELHTSGKKRYWMKITGLDFYRTVPKEIYRLASHTDLRITPETPRFDFATNYVPTPDDYCNQASMDLAKLTKLDEVTIETPAGRLGCIHYSVDFGADVPQIEIWVNPKILPTGIVRISTPTEVVELTSYGKNTDIRIPELMQPVIEGITTLEQGCTSCHGYDNCHEFISPPR